MLAYLVQSEMRKQKSSNGVVEDGRPTEIEHTIDFAQRAVQAGISARLLAAAKCNLQAYELSRSSNRCVAELNSTPIKFQ